MAESARLLHTWTAHDGVAWTTGVVLIGSWTHLDVPNRSDNGQGFGDVAIQPAIFTAAYGDLHVLFGCDVTLPTGRYSVHELVNPGLNYTTVSPQIALTWLPTKELELSLFSTVGFNSKNSDTQYDSGDYFDVDYSLGYRPFPLLPVLQFSVVGYFFEQFSDDKVNGVRFLDGHRGKTFAVGPQVRYQFDKGGITFKWQHETSAENRAQGDRFQLQFAVPF